MNKSIWKNITYSTGRSEATPFLFKGRKYVLYNLTAFNEGNLAKGEVDRAPYSRRAPTRRSAKCFTTTISIRLSWQATSATALAHTWETILDTGLPEKLTLFGLRT